MVDNQLNKKVNKNLKNEKKNTLLALFRDKDGININYWM